MFRKTILLTLLSLQAATFVFAGCAPKSVAPPTPTPEPTAEPLTLTDGLGREVSLPAPAQRVISLAPSTTEILFAVGAGGQVVGRDEFSDYPVEAKNLPSVGGAFTDYNAEAIVALKPDLILAAGINTPEQVKTLQDLGLTIYYLSNPTTLAEMYDGLLVVARLTGHESQAAALVDALEARVAAVEKSLAGIGERPVVFYELDSTNPAAPYTAGPGTFIDLLIRQAGGQNVGGALSSEWAQISIEQLLVQNPDIILLGDAAYGTTPESVKARAGWEALEAVKNDHIFPFDDNLASRPGPRLVDGLEALAKLLHPEAFK
jgi:iron complex transport system substrate-binding protein